ncbi:hypothetical protein Naga_100002g116 [Nannochloropsis gaditana]|uniref:Uncharacterized protein n=1 Tax=Nannochloropsis gaditana TaxID=72520 RepID=W7U760_9STRA|nr:hypothetical protein Naga_100002g116 [Nannochloropsis gaditana]
MASTSQSSPASPAPKGIYRPKLNLAYLFPHLRVEREVLRDLGDNVEMDPLGILDHGKCVLFAQPPPDIVTRLFFHFPGRAIRRRLPLVHFPLGEGPALPVPIADEENLVLRPIQAHTSVDWHRVLIAVKCLHEIRVEEEHPGAHPPESLHSTNTPVQAGKTSGPPRQALPPVD